MNTKNTEYIEVPRITLADAGVGIEVSAHKYAKSSVDEWTPEKARYYVFFRTSMRLIFMAEEGSQPQSMGMHTFIDSEFVDARNHTATALAIATMLERAAAKWRFAAERYSGEKHLSETFLSSQTE